MPTNAHGLRQRARQVIADQPYQTVTVLSSLLAVQDDMGYLPSEALDEVASCTGASVNEVWGVASFYPNFRLTQPPQHILEVCWGPTCHLLGAQPLLQGLLTHLGLSQEGDTDDGRFALKLNTCLGACPHGPVILVDGHLRGRMGLAKAVNIVDGLGANGE